jgi:phage terminase large subunit-like protein
MSSLTLEQRKKLKLLEMRKKLATKLSLAFDPHILDSRPTPAQLEIIKSKVPINFVVGSNRSGKTALGGRIISWWFMENHPYMSRPKEWGDKPIKILMMGQDTRNIQFEIFAEKIKPFIGVEGVDYKVKRDGGNVSAVTNLHNGNVIVFMSHSDAEQARRRGQGFTAQIVWLDEMPSISSILTELIMRVVTTNGYMYTTFTPLIRNDEIRKIVDSADGIKTKKWLISILDNPSLSEEKRTELVAYFRSISGSESEFRARMYGDWLAAESLVFKYNSDLNLDNPSGYDPQIWPHVAVVDPAASSIAGLSVWARHPSADVWWCVKAKYLNGQAFSELVQTVEGEISHFNIVKRICDCNPSGFYHEAYLQDIKYMPVSDKQYNKENMIDACNKALLEETVYLTNGAQTLIDELTVCSRHEDDPSRILKASKYHTADTFRYFIHAKPKYEGPKQVVDREALVRYNWKQHLKKEGEKYQATKEKQARKELKRLRRRRW